MKSSARAGASGLGNGVGSGVFFSLAQVLQVLSLAFEASLLCAQCTRQSKSESETERKKKKTRDRNRNDQRERDRQRRETERQRETITKRDRGRQRQTESLRERQGRKGGGEERDTVCVDV